MKTVDKAMFLLRQFSLESLEIGLNDLSRKTGQDKAITRRLLVSLIKHGFVEQNSETRKYRLGHGFLALARIREATVPMVRATQVAVEWLSSVTSETTHAGVPGPYGMAAAAYSLPERGNIISFRPAEIYPYHASASGLAYLAFCDEKTRAKLFGLERVKLTPFTITDENALLEMIRGFQKQGYTRTGSTVDIGVCSIAMPFFRDGLNPAGTIAIAIPEANMDSAREKELLGFLRKAVRNLEVALTGGTSLP